MDQPLHEQQKVRTKLEWLEPTFELLSQPESGSDIAPTEDNTFSPS